MPGLTLPNTGITLPELGGDPGEWDDLINACWENYDEHDHTPGKGVQVPIAGLDIDDDLSMAGFGIEDAARLELAPVETPSSGSLFFFVDDATSDLYFRTAGGVNLKLTDGANINVSLIGGIGGDYASVGALVAYDDANDTYTFKQEGSPRPWARIDVGDVRIHEYATNENVYVSLKVPASLASNVDITLLPDLPTLTTTSLLQINEDGEMFHSNVLAEDFEVQGDFTAQGQVTFGSDLTMGDAAKFNGAVEFTDRLILDLIPYVTEAIERKIPLTRVVRGDGTDINYNDGRVIGLGTSTDRHIYPVDVAEGETITAWSVYINDSTTPPDVATTARLYKSNAVTQAETALGSLKTSGQLGYEQLSNTGLSIDAENSSQYYIVVIGGGTNGTNIFHATYSTQRVP